MKKILFRVLFVLLFLYIALCVFFYFFQERVIFFPTKLDKNYAYQFEGDFEEINITSENGISINTLLFKTNSDTLKDCILYLHGNAGTLKMWGNMASQYTGLGYDILFLDYRGFGKSDGKIIDEEQLFRDNQVVYDTLKQRYGEQNITIIGFSIGTGMAAKLAADNDPRMLILKAPYYELTDVVQEFCPVIPDFLVRYKLETYKYLQECKMPIYVFHGTDDWTINHNNSIKLKQLLKDSDRLILLQDVGHNTIPENGQFCSELAKILN